jgi:hypothetical protein
VACSRVNFTFTLTFTFTPEDATAMPPNIRSRFRISVASCVTKRSPQLRVDCTKRWFLNAVCRESHTKHVNKLCGQWSGWHLCVTGLTALSIPRQRRCGQK